MPQADLERTLNCGVGMVALTAPEATPTRRSRVLAGHGIPAWVLGEVATARTPPSPAASRSLHGAKGVNGGSVQVVGTDPRPEARGPGVREQPRAGSVVHTYGGYDETGHIADTATVRPAERARGPTLWGGGRAKAKQTKVARDLRVPEAHETDCR